MRLPLIVLALLPSAFVMASDAPVTLMSLYEASLQHDANYRSISHARDAAQQEETIGRARLLPQVGLNARYGHAGEINGKTVGVDQIDSISADSITLSMQQPLYDKERWAQYEQSIVRGHIGEFQFENAGQVLFDRVVEAYFDVARLENEHKLNAQQTLAIEGLAQQTRRLLDAGEGTITDQEEAQARLDLVKAQGIELQTRYRAALRKLSGRTAMPVPRIATMQERLPSVSLLSPEQTLDYWMDQGRDSSALLELRRASVELAQRDVELQQAGHYPVVSLTSQVSRTGKSDLDEFSQRQSSYYVGVQVNVPLYQGGGVVASVKRAELALLGAQSDYEAEFQRLAEDIESNYLAVVSGFDNGRAMQTAVSSSQRAFLSAQKGYQAGVRSTVEILDAQQRVFAARRDLLNAKLVMLQGYVKLYSRTGQMTLDVLQRVQELF